MTRLISQAEHDKLVADALKAHLRDERIRDIGAVIVTIVTFASIGLMLAWRG